VPLLSRHGLRHRVERSNLLGLLTQSARSTTPGCEDIHAVTSWDAPLLPNLFTDFASAQYVGDGYEHDSSTAAARLPNLFSDLAGYVAGTEPRTEANAAVTEAPE